MIAGRDVAVVNGCGVTNRAVKETRAAVRRLRRSRPGAELVVTGCASEMERAAFAAMPEVDRIVPNAAKLLPESWGRPGNMPAPRRHTRGFVKVQDGCDHACTFCAIPQGRGASRSEPVADIVQRVAMAVEDGVKEVVLSGVDLASYADGGGSLALLVERILAGVPRLARLRLSTLDPAAIDDRLFALLTQEPRVMPHVHLSLQAGGDLTLKRMRRRHRRADVVRLVGRLKAARCGIAIGADLIAGFPTETEAMFADTLAMLDDADIVHAHVFPYSPRAGTPAARMPQVPVAIVADRAARLRTAAATRKAGWLRSLVGTRQPIVAERPGDRGHSPAHADVRLSSPVTVGDLVTVRVTDATDTHLLGTPE